MWSKKWKEILIWLSGFFGFLTFALVGGYVIVKGEDEDLKKTTKQCFFVFLIFTAITAFFSLFNAIAGMSDSYGYGSSAYKFYTVMTNLVTVAQIITYAVFIVLAIVKKEDDEQ